MTATTAVSKPPRYSLALHTTTPNLGLALGGISGLERQQIWPLGRRMANELHKHLNHFLIPQAWTDLAFLAVARGPGGFTGTRLGVVTARTLAQQLEVPLFAISTLAAFAYAQGLGQAADLNELAIVMQAQRGQLYAAIYGVKEPGEIPQALIPDQVLMPDHWENIRANWPRPLKVLTVGDDLAYSVTAVLAIAQHQFQLGERPHWSKALPFYGQSPVS